MWMTNRMIVYCYCLLEYKRLIEKSLIFGGDFNAHHVDWLNCMSLTNHHGLPAYDFSSISVCEQNDSAPTHVSGNCIGLLFTDVPGVDVSVGASIGSSDHNSVNITELLNESVPNFS